MVDKIIDHETHSVDETSPVVLVADDPDLAGNFEAQITDEKQRRSFELFRSSLSGIEVITFDEFFKKLEHLADLFSLVRKKPA